MRILAKKDLWPVDPLLEQNWSGRGQHVEFRKDERKLVEQLLWVDETLGQGSAAIVQSVRCQRIMLARKTIFCNRKLTKDEAIDEVAHLTRLSHSHIVRLIGTYTLGRELSILIYPVAEQNLEEFLDTFSMNPKKPYDQVLMTGKYRKHNHFSMNPSDHVKHGMRLYIEKFLVCLSDTLNYIHSTLVKHMDIKPQNLLVRSLQNAPLEYPFPTHKIYFADFGVSRSYQRLEDVETNGPSSFTRKYAAPEVIEQESQGFPADVFSLGCVFLEIIASLYANFQRRQYCFTHFVRGNWQPANIQSASDDLQAILDTNSGGLRYYYANIDRLKDYFASRDWNCMPFAFPEGTVPLIERMLSFDPEARPTPQQLVDHFGKSRCCSTGPEALEAYQDFGFEET
jgi:serine/threonine protein kinase